MKLTIWSDVMREQLIALKPYELRKVMKFAADRRIRCLAYAIWLERKHARR